MAISGSTPPPGGLSAAALTHASALLGVFFALKAWSYALDRFLLLYDDNGVVVGAGYTDLHVELPVLWLLIGVRRRRRHRVLGQYALADLPDPCRRRRC